MTSEFDEIMEIGWLMVDTKLSKSHLKEFEEILSEAIRQASIRRPSKWNFDLWLNKQWQGKTEAEVDAFYKGCSTAKLEFLSDTHSILDHTDKWHHKVFNRELIKRIYDFYNKVKQ